MKCNYKTVAAQKQKTDVCDHLGNRWLEYIEAVSAIELNRLFGWKAKRLGDMYEGVSDMLSELMEMYASEGEDIWETTLTANHGLAMRLRGIGVDIKAWMTEIPVTDRFGSSWRGRRDRDLHDFRAQWVGTMEKKLTVYWAVLMLWLNERHGHGAVRLKRAFAAMRSEYVRFAGLYLMCRDRENNEMVRMIESKVRAAKAMLGEVEEQKSVVTVEEFLEEIAKKASCGLL